MTLSNFDWTDKDSVKWFILLPTGHEGPYSLNKLSQLKEQKKFAREVKIWAEGLGEPIFLRHALKDTHSGLPDLPPIPDDDIPPIPFFEENEEQDIPTPLVRKTLSFPLLGFFIVISLVMVFFVFSSLVKKNESFSLRRFPKMTHHLHERILAENSFNGWDKKIFFKEYLPDDHSHIWLITTSFQQCDVEATFSALSGKLLSLNEEKVSFKTKGRLSGHVVEFSAFDFINGNKIIPGMYEMSVKASNCEWEGFIPKLVNKFQSPDAKYMASTKVVLFSKGAVEFNTVLDRLIKKKTTQGLKEQNQNELFWQDLQQKLETLQAVALQVEQLILDFLDNPAAAFLKTRGPMIDKYTRQFGSFLTTFVVENESYFKNLRAQGKGSSQKRNYEFLVNVSSKRIGLESMKFIEEFQAVKKNPTQAEVNLIKNRVKQVYSAIKNDINGKIIQVSEDRSL